MLGRGPRLWSARRRVRMRCGGKATCWSISALAIHGLLVCGAAAEPDPPTTHLRDYYRYCIVGAGPGVSGSLARLLAVVNVSGCSDPSTRR